jgi:tetratricopeptide (TPR) repeat protein
MRARAAPRPAEAGQAAPPQLQRSFVDRERHKALFSEILAAPATEHSRVLVWHGDGGLGKTALRHEFERQLAAQRAQRKVALCVLDLELQHLRHDPVDAMRELRITLGQEGVGKFPYFDTAFAQLYALERPGRNLRADHPALFSCYENGFVGEAAQLADGLAGGLPICALIYKYGTRAMAWLGDAWGEVKAHEALGRIQAMPAHQLRQNLPAWLGDDLRAAMAGPAGRRIVLMLDTYEALWQDSPASGPQNILVDDWIRTMLRRAPGLLVLVFCREALDWSEAGPAWAQQLHQEPLEALPAEDTTRLLEQAGIASEAVRASIVQAAQGLPFYVECALEIHGDILRYQQRTPEPDDFGDTPTKVLQRLVNHLPPQEVNDLKLASYLETIGEPMLRTLGHGLRAGAADWSGLRRRGLLTLQADGTLRMQALLRDGLQRREREERPDFYAEAHTFLFAHHDRQLAETRAAQLGPAHDNTLRLALHHRLHAALPDTPRWLLQRHQVFADAGRWVALDRAFQRVAAALGPFAPDPADPDADAVWFHHHHASVLQHMGAFDDAIAQYRLALTNHPQDAHSSARPRHATILDALANVHCEKGEHPKAEPLYQQALEIYEAAPGQFPIRHAWALRQLARCHGADGRTESARRCAERARGLFEALADSHPREYAGFLLDLGRDRLAQARPDEAIGLLEQALQHYRLRGADTDSAATALLDIAVCRARLDDAGAAATAFEAAVDAHIAVYGAEHPNTGHALHLRAAFWLGETATAAQAPPQLSQATRILAQSLGTEHAWTRAARADLARAEAMAAA